MPEAPQFAGFRFIKWVVEAGDLENGINIQTIYEANEIRSIPSEMTDTKDITNKLIREGNLYILRGEKTFTITGAEVK